MWRLASTRIHGYRVHHIGWFQASVQPFRSGVGVPTYLVVHGGELCTCCIAIVGCFRIPLSVCVCVAARGVCVCVCVYVL